MSATGAFGVKVKITVASTMTAIAGIRDVEFPEFEKILTESTAHDSTDGYATYVDTGKRKANSFKITLNWDSAAPTHAAILTAFDSTSPVNMSVEDPAGAEVIAFPAFITKIGRVAEQEDVYSCDVEIQPTGKPTIS